MVWEGICCVLRSEGQAVLGSARALQGVDVLSFVSGMGIWVTASFCPVGVSRVVAGALEKLCYF